MTVVKAYRDPGTETLTTWFASFCAAALAIVAVGELNWVLLAYPLYLFALNGAIVGAMMLGRTRSIAAPLFTHHQTKNAAQ